MNLSCSILVDGKPHRVFLLAYQTIVSGKNAKGQVANYPGPFDCRGTIWPALAPGRQIDVTKLSGEPPYFSGSFVVADDGTRLDADDEFQVQTHELTADMGPVKFAQLLEANREKALAITVPVPANLLKDDSQKGGKKK